MSGSSSPSPAALLKADSFFAGADDSAAAAAAAVHVMSASSASASPPPAPLALETDVCSLFCCAGGTIECAAKSKSVLKACTRRLADHARGQVCPRHHAHIKCSTCQATVHVGCWTQVANGEFVLPKASSWCCGKCPIDAPVPFVKEEGLATAADSAALEVAVKPFVMFCNKETLVKTFKMEGWRTRNSNEKWLRFDCTTCDVKFSASNIADPDDDTERWRVSGKPASHSCHQGGTTTYHISKLSVPEEVLKAIEMLAVSRACLQSHIIVCVVLMYTTLHLTHCRLF